jgi:hypothetical protein
MVLVIEQLLLLGDDEQLGDVLAPAMSSIGAPVSVPNFSSGLG